MSSTFPPLETSRADRDAKRTSAHSPATDDAIRKRHRSLQTVLAQAWCYASQPGFILLLIPIVTAYLGCSLWPGLCGIPTEGGHGQSELVKDFPETQIETAFAESNPSIASQMSEPARRRTIAVVGAGLGGLSALISAHEHLSRFPTPFPAQLILIDKQNNLGGNSAKASSGFNAVNSTHQFQAGINDTPDLFVSDTLAAGRNLSDPALVSILATESAPTLAWLEQQSGLELARVSRCGGHSVPRTHRLVEAGKPRAVGWELLSALGKKAKAIEASGEEPKVQILTGIRVVKLKAADGAISSISYIRADETLEAVYNDPDLLVGNLPGDFKTHEMPVDALILTTGGFSRSPALLANVPANDEHPALDKLPTTNSPFTTGDGIHLARALDHRLEPINMQHLQIHPSGFVDPKDPYAVTKMLAPEALRAHGGILVNAAGRRFVNELGRRDTVSTAIFAQLDLEKPTVAQSVFLVLDRKAYEEVGTATMDFYTGRGMFRVFATIEEMGEGLGIPVETLRVTLESYAAHAASGHDEFGKTVFPNDVAEGPWRVARVTPVLHYSPGGLPFLPSGEICSQAKHVVVKNLFGAGEVTGGVHGGGRLAGNSLAECGVWGRRSGVGAAKALK